MWKNFTNGMMDHWLSESYAKETLDLDKTYDFLQGFSNMNASTFTMREAFDVGLENLYMGFNYHILNDNEETLHADLMKTIAQYGEDFVKMIGADTALHHAFVYKGMAYRTGVHQAPASDWFFQIGNGKVWRFVEPKYTPYLRPHSPDGISTMSAYDYFPDDFGVGVRCSTVFRVFYGFPHLLKRFENMRVIRPNAFLLSSAVTELTLSPRRSSAQTSEERLDLFRGAWR